MRCRILQRLAGFGRDTAGAALVEFSVVVILFFLGMFAVIDFGRLAFTGVSTETAVRLATRIAVTRPPVCAGVPDRNLRSVVAPPSGTQPPRFGTSCSVGSYVCLSASTVTCNGSAGNPTASEIWTRIAPLMPSGATVADLSFSYRFDGNLGYLGGPYVPMVTVEARRSGAGLPYTFLSPLGPLATAAGGGSGSYGTINLPRYSVSLPAEDLAVGEAG